MQLSGIKTKQNENVIVIDSNGLKPHGVSTGIYATLSLYYDAIAKSKFVFVAINYL